MLPFVTRAVCSRDAPYMDYVHSSLEAGLTPVCGTGPVCHEALGLLEGRVGFFHDWLCVSGQCRAGAGLLGSRIESLWAVSLALGGRVLRDSACLLVSVSPSTYTREKMLERKFQNGFYQQWCYSGRINSQTGCCQCLISKQRLSSSCLFGIV